MIPLGFLAASGPKAVNLTGVESLLYAGGGSAGGQVVKYTGETLTAGQTYTVTIGAAYNNSSALGRTATASGGSYNLNGSTTTYSSGSGFFDPGGFQRPNEYYSSWQAGGGTAGAGGNGQNAINAKPNYYQGGYGGAPRTAYSVSGSTIPTAVGAGGGGFVSPSSVYYFNYDFSYSSYMYGYGGNYWTPAGANTGNAQSFNGPAAGSGGFILVYPATQAPLTATTGTVEVTVAGGNRYYFWKSSGSFTV